MRAGRCANRVAKGEVVALLMENRPEYLMAWLGLVKTGAVAALINTHLVEHAARPFRRTSPAPST